MPATKLRIDLPDRYRALRHIATGGMAAVYAAADEVLGREVAIKLLSPALAVDESARERFQREARAAARVGDHPNVVTVYDIGETNGDPPAAFIVMELLAGPTIHERLRSGEAIPHTLALRWLGEVAAALDTAHAHGIVHRDVKPANLLLDANGTLKVADFGIATLATDSSLTKTGQVVGTAAYFSPEQALGKPATAASDRYALAVLAYELLTGQRPFPPGPPAAQALARVDSEPPTATSVAPGLPNEVDDVLCRGMARDPDQRPATAAQLVAELHDALGPTATTGKAVPVPVPETEVVRQRTPRPPRASTPPPPPPSRPRPAPAAATGGRPGRSRAGVIAAIAALLLLVGAGAAAILSGGGDDPEQQASTTASTTKKPAAKQKTTTTDPATTAAPTPAASKPKPTPKPAAAPTGGVPADASAIQASAHQALAGGDYAGAVQQLRGLVDRCPVSATDPCAYAWFDYGYALRRAGDPAGAVSALEVRATNPDQAGTVQAELDAARAEAAGTTKDSGKVPPGQAKKDG
ncbi:MAG: serine/threonine-protein kinase [Solirubrobacteraceae bacterium]